MLKCIITFYDCCQKAIAESPVEKKVTWAYIKTTMAHVMQKVIDAKFLVRSWLWCLHIIYTVQDPKTPIAEMRSFYDNLAREIEEGFQAIGDV